MILKHTFFILIFLSFISCQNNRLENYEDSIKDFLIKNQNKEKFELSLDTISLFEWDELIVAGPYTNLDKVSRNGQYNFNKFPDFLESFDNYVLIGFINNKTGIYYMQIDRHLVSDSIFESKTRGYRIYSKEDSKFIIYH